MSLTFHSPLHSFSFLRQTSLPLPLRLPLSAAAVLIPANGASTWSASGPKRIVLLRSQLLAVRTFPSGALPFDSLLSSSKETVPRRNVTTSTVFVFFKLSAVPLAALAFSESLSSAVTKAEAVPRLRLLGRRLGFLIVGRRDDDNVRIRVEGDFEVGMVGSGNETDEVGGEVLVWVRKGATKLSRGGVGGRGRIAGFGAGVDVVLGGEGSGRVSFALPLPLSFFSLGSSEEAARNSMVEPGRGLTIDIE